MTKEDERFVAAKALRAAGVDLSKGGGILSIPPGGRIAGFMLGQTPERFQSALLLGRLFAFGRGEEAVPLAGKLSLRDQLKLRLAFRRKAAESDASGWKGSKAAEVLRLAVPFLMLAAIIADVAVGWLAIRSLPDGLGSNLIVVGACGQVIAFAFRGMVASFPNESVPEIAVEPLSAHETIEIISRS
jgi:hypothetical protein